MATAKGDVVLKLGVDDAAVGVSLSRTEGAVRRLGGAGQQAGRGMGSLSGALKDYAREERQQSRHTSFFAKELASLLPISNGAASALGRLGGVLAGGIGIGLAFEGIKFIVESLTAMKRESEAAAQAWKDSFASIDEFGKPVEEALRRLQLEARGFTGAMIDAVEAMERAKTVKLPDGREMSANDALVEAGIQARMERQKNQRFYNAKGEFIAPEAGTLQDKELKANEEAAKRWEAVVTQIENRDKRLRELATLRNKKESDKEAEKRAAADAKKWEGGGPESMLPRAADFDLSPDAYLAPMSGPSVWSLDATRAKAMERLGRAQDAGSLDKTGKNPVVADILGSQDDLTKALAERQEAIKTFAEGMKSTVSGALEGTLVSIFDKDFASIGKMWESLVKQMVAKAAVLGFINAVTGGQGGFVGGVLGMFGGKRAAGGPVAAGTAYLVGEKGPEIMVPSTAGNVIPNHALQASRTTQVNLTVQALDAASFEDFMLAKGKRGLLRTMRELMDDGR